MSQKITIIKPRSAWKSIDFQELWSYRELLITFAVRDIKVRYKQTVLGVAWAVLQPLTTMIVFSLLFGRLAQVPSEGFPYPIFVFSGLLAWNFFQTAISSGGISLVSSAGMISKVYFPRIIVPLASIAVSIVDFFIAFGILLILMLIYSVSPTWQFLLLPLFFVGLVFLVAGFNAWLSAITVTYRDFRFVIPFMLQLWMYLTPVIYPVSFIPENWRWVLHINPMYGWIEGVRACVLGLPINWPAALSSSVLTLLIVLIGVRYFDKAEQRFADVI